jgi:TatD DNase family protein
MIDTHAHLSGRFSEEIKIKGLDYVILAASCVQDSKDNLELSKINKKILPAIGIHPMEINESFEGLEKLFTDRVVAIGECGLEFSDEMNQNDKKKQIELFKKQIELSQKVDRPLIVHSRGASDEMLEILGNFKNLKGVIHCYSGGKKRINKFLDLPGVWYFGIDGNLTYEIGLEQVVQNIPKDRLILETDCPYLTPVPFRGEKNYPEYVKYVYQKVAEIWEISFKEAEKIVDENAKRLFKIKP